MVKLLSLKEKKENATTISHCLCSQRLATPKGYHLSLKNGPRKGHAYSGKEIKRYTYAQNFYNKHTQIREIGGSDGTLTP